MASILSQRNFKISIFASLIILYGLLFIWFNFNGLNNVYSNLFCALSTIIFGLSVILIGNNLSFFLKTGQVPVFLCSMRLTSGLIGWIILRSSGGVPKRSTGTDCKSVGSAFEGSNPSPSTKNTAASGCE